MKETAVEWLENNLKSHFEHDGDLLEIVQMSFDQAKEMEKQQMFEYIKNNYVNGENSLKFHTEEFEQYYNETFKSE